MRLGDLYALKEDLKQYFSDGTLDSVSAKLAFNMILRKIDEAPTVEIPNYGGQVVPDTLQGWRYEERPQGEWKRHDEWRSGEYIGGFYHVNCPYEDGYYSKWETNFCPNCGLPMKKGGAVWMK